MVNPYLPYSTCWKITILIDPTTMNNTKRNVKNFANNKEKGENGKSVNHNLDQCQDLDQDRDRVLHILLIIHVLKVLNVSLNM